MRPLLGELENEDCRNIIGTHLGQQAKIREPGVAWSTVFPRDFSAVDRSESLIGDLSRHAEGADRTGTEEGAFRADDTKSVRAPIRPKYVQLLSN
jgi:hypothetical protein